MKNTIIIFALILAFISCKKEKTANTLPQLIIDNEQIHLAIVKDSTGITVRNKPSKEGKSIGGFGFGSNVKILSSTGKFEKIKSWNGKIVSGQWVEVYYPNKKNALDTCYVFDGFLAKKKTITSFNTVNEFNDTITISKEVLALENELIKYKLANKLIIDDNKKVKTVLDSLQKEIGANYFNKQIIDVYLKESEHFFNYNKLVNNLFNQLNLDKENFISSLGNNNYIFNKHDNDFNDSFYKEKKEIPFLNYMWNSFDRSKENINVFFTDEIKSVIYSLFRNNNIYTNSGMKNKIESLLLAYEEISENKELLNQIYFKSFNGKNALKQYKIIDRITSKEMLKLIQNYEAPYNHSDSYRAFQIYSFWARRYKEDNMEVIFKLLKEFNENIKEKKDLDKMLPEIMF